MVPIEIEILSIGNVIGSFFAGPCADRWGRKWGMVIGSVITLIGAIIQASAQAKRDLIAGRVVLGVGTVMLGPSAQSYAVGKLQFLIYKYFIIIEVCHFSNPSKKCPIPHIVVLWSVHTRDAFFWERVSANLSIEKCFS